LRPRGEARKLQVEPEHRSGLNPCEASLRAIAWGFVSAGAPIDSTPPAPHRARLFPDALSSKGGDPMRLVATLAVLAGTVLTTGCGLTLSVNRLFTEKDLVSDDRIVGKWTDEKAETVMEVRKEGDGYVAVESGKSDYEAYAVHIVPIAQTRFLDVAPQKSHDLAIDGHLFVKMRLTDDELEIQTPDWDWLADRATEAGLSQFVTANKQRILAAPTADLQKFLALYATEPKAFENDIPTLHRKR
jgi:hypothetical protein